MSQLFVKKEYQKKANEGTVDKGLSTSEIKELKQNKFYTNLGVLFLVLTLFFTFLGLILHEYIVLVGIPMQLVAGINLFLANRS